MTTEGTRRDLIEALLQSCWLVEAGRGRVLASWGGEFGAEAEGVADRAGLLRGALQGRGIPPPEHVLDPHTWWLESVCGSSPTDVPLGAGLLQRLGEWTDVYARPHLADPDRFEELGRAELRLPVPPRPLREEEAALARLDVPPGRRFVILTDIHIGADGTDALAERAVEEINALYPEHVVVPGDLTEDGEPEQFRDARRILEGLDAPYSVVLGNHDAVRRSTREPAGAQLFAETFGHAPADRVLHCGPLQVALVDSSDPTPSPFPDWDLGRGSFREDAGGVNNGTLRPGQAEELAAALDPARPTLLVLHHELQPFAGFPPVIFGLLEPHSQTLLDALGPQRLIGVVAGHTHRSFHSEVGNGVPQLEVPSLKDWPYTYTVVAVQEEQAHVLPRQVGDPDLVWRNAERVPPIYLRYARGPVSSLHHTFDL